MAITGTNYAISKLQARYPTYGSWDEEPDRLTGATPDGCKWIRAYHTHYSSTWYSYNIWKKTLPIQGCGPLHYPNAYSFSETIRCPMAPAYGSSCWKVADLHP